MNKSAKIDQDLNIVYDLIANTDKDELSELYSELLAIRDYLLGHKDFPSDINEYPQAVAKCKVIQYNLNTELGDWYKKRLEFYQS